MGQTDCLSCRRYVPPLCAELEHLCKMDYLQGTGAVVARIASIAWYFVRGTGIVCWERGVSKSRPGTRTYDVPGARYLSGSSASNQTIRGELHTALSYGIKRTQRKWAGYLSLHTPHPF